MTKDMTPLLGYRLKLAQHALHRRMEEALKPLGLNPAQYAVLAELNARPDQTNADLAERAFITPQSMQGVLAKLEEAKLVARRQDVRHGRRQLARLTPEGHEKAEAANAAVMRVEEVLEGAVHPAAIQDAVDLMDRLHNAMCK
jgi:DNA-binding MarR family transcriptional regulator